METRQQEERFAVHCLTCNHTDIISNDIACSVGGFRSEAEKHLADNPKHEVLCSRIWIRLPDEELLEAYYEGFKEQALRPFEKSYDDRSFFKETLDRILKGPASENINAARDLGRAHGMYAKAWSQI